MASIVLTGLAANDPVPGSYLETNFAQGAASSGTTQYAILLVGNKTTAGSATNNTVVYGPDTQIPLSNQSDADALFGPGGELARMYMRVLRVNTSVPVYAVAVAPSAGLAATGTITFTNAATANGYARMYILDEFIDVSVTSGDAANTIAINAALQINSRTDWPFTATAPGSGVVTLTAKNLGLRGNWLRYAAQMFGGGATTVTPTVMTYCTGGTVADSYTAALATMLPKRYYYVVSADDGSSSTNLSSLVSQVNTQALPINDIRQRVFAGSVDTLANCTTVSTGLNGALAEVAWLAQSDWPPSELAANEAAVVALNEAPFSAQSCNMDGYGNDVRTQASWKVPAPRSGAAPTRAQIFSALNNGITPIGVNGNRSTYIVSRITTRCLSGATPDYRIRDAFKVSIVHRFADDFQAKIRLQFAGKLIGDDPQPGQRFPGPMVVTPQRFKAAATKLVSEYGEADLLQNVPATIANTQAQRETSPTSRISCRIPLATADAAHQFATALDQVA